MVLIYGKIFTNILKSESGEKGIMIEKSLLRLNEYYIAGMRPIISKASFYSDTTPNFISPAEPMPYDLVTVVSPSSTSD